MKYGFESLSLLLVVVHVDAVVGSAEGELVGLVWKIQSETSLRQSSDFGSEDMVWRALLAFLVEPNLWIGPCWACPEIGGIPAIVGGTVKVLCIVYVTSPVDLLDLLARLQLVELQLLLRGITPRQNNTVWVVKRFSWDVGPVEVPRAATLPQVPDMDNTVPTARNNGVLIDKFNSEYAIIVTNVVPSCRTKVNNHCLRIFVNKTVPSS